MGESDAAERFLSAPLWADLDVEPRRAVFEALVADHAPAGTKLMHQGRPNDRFSTFLKVEEAARHRADVSRGA